MADPQAAVALKQPTDVRETWQAISTRVLEPRNRYLAVLDAVLMLLGTLLAFATRFEGLTWPSGMATIATAYVIVVTPLKLAVFLRAGLYGRMWRYAGAADVERLFVAALTAGTLAFVLGAYILPASGIVPARVPLSVLVLDLLITIAAAALPRFAVRTLQRRRRARGRRSEGRRVLIAGAGAAGGLIAKELQENPQLELAAVGFVDDDRSKHGRRINDLPVLGSLDQIQRLVETTGVEEVIIAMPAAPGSVLRNVVQAATAAGATTRTVPGLFELISGRKSVNALRQVEIQDLLRREPIETDLAQVRELAQGRTVLVTGAGGSIGSELCRQLARLQPSCIVALGRGENSIFELLHEMGREFPGVRIEPYIADVRDPLAVREVFRRYRPASVFHAAAHKHVPLMESNPAEAVLNNVLGTLNVVQAAAEFDAERFVLISTDKAVRPTSIMGATKRVAEMVVQHASARSGRPYVSVRFGNVLGSRGSVVPTFLRQIAAGGPVTITHPEMRRYFMTIPEAVQLVLQAGAIGQGSETFVLDMGAPVRIADLAADLIRLSGLQVGQDIEIQYTGTRPGEKLYEELFFSAESASPTVHPKVLRANSLEFCPSSASLVNRLLELARGGSAPAEIRRVLGVLVPDYAPTGALAPPASVPPAPRPGPPTPDPVRPVRRVAAQGNGRPPRAAVQPLHSAVAPIERP